MAGLTVRFEQERQAALFASRISAPLRVHKCQGALVELAVDESLDAGALCRLAAQALADCQLESATVELDGRSFLLSAPTHTRRLVRGIAARG